MPAHPTVHRRPSARLAHTIAATIATTLLAAAAPAQCPGRWLDLSDVASPNSTIDDLAIWDPDGAGPQPEGLVAVGIFTAFGDLPARRVAFFSGSEWSPLGDGVGVSTWETVRAVVVMPDNSIVVAGLFSVAGGVPAESIARWTGTTWQPLADGLNATVYDLTLDLEGRLIAVGEFRWSGSPANPMNGVARFDGATWTNLNPSPNFYSIFAAATMPSGDLIVAGAFHDFAGVPASRIARFDGSAWHPLGPGLNGLVYALLPLPNADLIAAGTFTMSGNTFASRIARWDGATWTALGQGIGPDALSTNIASLARLTDGTIVAAGFFSTAGGRPASTLAQWSGRAWYPMPGIDDRSSLGLTFASRTGGDLAVAGHFTRQSEPGAPRNFAIWRQPPWPPACAGDYDCSGAIKPEDLFAFLHDFFASDPRADINASGAATVQDVFDFLTAWFSPC